MASQSALLLTERTVEGGLLEVRLRLACGCEVLQIVRPDRVQTDVQGARFAVGKVPCPVRHPVARP